MFVVLTGWYQIDDLIRLRFLAVTEVRQEGTVTVTDVVAVHAVLLPELGLVELLDGALGQQWRGHLNGLGAGGFRTSVQEDRHVQWQERR
ncbi:hypothetical protein D3C81_2180680 [compost metagenome]